MSWNDSGNYQQNYGGYGYDQSQNQQVPIDDFFSHILFVSSSPPRKFMNVSPAPNLIQNYDQGYSQPQSYGQDNQVFTTRFFFI